MRPGESQLLGFNAQDVVDDAPDAVYINKAHSCVIKRALRLPKVFSKIISPLFSCGEMLRVADTGLYTENEFDRKTLATFTF
jgi:hypothetical protein